MNFSNVNIFDLIILLGAIQGIFFAIFLWIRPVPNRKASFFLSLFILGFALNSIYNSLEGLGTRRGDLTDPWEWTPLYCSLLIIASLYFFVEYLVRPNRSFTWKEAHLFAPYGFQLIFQSLCLYWSIAKKDFIRQNAWEIINIFSIIDLVAVISGLFVLILTVVKINRYEEDLLKNYAEVSNFSLAWLKRLIFLLFGIWLLFAVPTIYEQITHKSPVEIFYPMWLATSALIYWIGYSTYFRKDLSAAKLFHEEKIIEKNIPKGLSEKTAPYYQNLLKLMEEEKPYLNPDLNLKMLAESLDLSSGYLSQIINQYEEKNFFDFVNIYRVNTVKEKLHDPAFQHLSLLGIAYEAGFKSKSTFNLAFKKIAGLTPSAFKKQLKN